MSNDIPYYINITFVNHTRIKMNIQDDSAIKIISLGMDSS